MPSRAYGYTSLASVSLRTSSLTSASHPERNAQCGQTKSRLSTLQRPQGQGTLRLSTRRDDEETHPTKCDQALPECHRCQRNGRQCPGYPTATDVTFRNTLSTNIDQQQQRQLSTTSSQQSRSTSSISSPMPTDWNGQSVCLFLHDYVIKSNEDNVFGFGFLQCLPDLLQRSDDTPACQEAVSALALMSLAHRSSLEYLLPQARQRYGKSLSLVAGALRKQENLDGDAILAAVLCLGYYEVLFYAIHPDQLPNAPSRSLVGRNFQLNQMIGPPTSTYSKRFYECADPTKNRQSKPHSYPSTRTQS